MSTEELLALEVMPTSMTPAELEAYAQKYYVVSLQQQGLSAAAALEKAKCERTTAWATKCRRRFEAFGASGLLDLRKFNQKESDTMTNDVKEIVLRVWHGNLAQGPRLITKEVAGICKDRQLPVPSESSVKQYLESLPDPIKLTRGGYFDTWDKQAKPTLPFRPTKHANQRYQSDHTRMDIWARMLVGGVWLPVVLYLTVMLDDFSRAIAGMTVTVGTANSWSITQALRHALLPKAEPGWLVHGRPIVFQCDRGADFTSHAITTAMAVLGITVDLDPPNYPNRKGKVERWFQTLDQGCLRALPGHMAAIGSSEGAALKNLHKLLTPDQIEQEVKRWIVEEYHHRTHSVTNRKPLELWQETVQLVVPDEAAVFRVLLRMDGQLRKVQRMLKFSVNGQGGLYWSPDLLPLYGRRVRVAYNPEDMRRIAIHCELNGEFLAEPWLLGHPESPFTRDHVKAERRGYRRGLKALTARYLEESRANEAEAADAQEWDDARAANAADEECQHDPELVDPEDEEAAEILEDLMNRRRNGDG
jgi:putative transposase